MALKDLGPEEALKCIINSKDCKENIIDFTKPISRMYKSVIPMIISHYNFSLTSAVTLEERRILIDLGLCHTLDDEEKLLRSLFENNNVSENIKHLRTAINGLFDIWRSKRLNDRAECCSAVIKKLKETNKDLAQQRVDFILRNNHDGSDYLTSEEKPTDKEALYDFKKGKEMQRNMLTLWSNWLNSSTLVGELEAVTCQWQERKLTVFGTRMLPSGHFIVYKKATAFISSVSGHYGAAAKLLQIVLSLKRLVTLNHMKLISMIDAIEKYSNDNLDLSVNADQPYVTYYGSSQESASSKEKEEEPEYVQEALSKSRSVKHPDDVVSMGDWEKMIIDDVNQELQIKK
ncbi:uncharacterized protein BX663DRAFT_484161 [Cokeromyces recurvatus]|uniref:uncharacterized protein n=1 Tax=Cokeromyces recurvatus TaxID=90255 RepID=UPI0022203BCC|nr:uncharacterized protein BX663DRAFT_484161 [Cokeromyces recurvatus]KAI7905685.1 hypothetical protein BX663DRAFT_484161 [Cokeromyces recurvatus]